MTRHERFPKAEASPVTVRIGTPEDVHPMMRIALRACEENGLSNPNPTYLLQHIWAALNQDHGLVGIIGAPGEEIEGAVLLRIGPMWYSDDPILDEKAIFIAPEHRSAKGGRASRLCEFSKSVADALGIPLVIGVLSSARTASKVRMYQRHFGEPSGAYWIYGAKTGAAEPIVAGDV
jgi:hypothetical protein